MTHHMRLFKEPFEQIKSGTKTIELRLNDEKRRQVKPGDFIEFTETKNPDSKIMTKVIALHSFGSFQELYENLPLLQCGYTEADIADANPEDMNDYYSRELQEQYGVLGIELALIANQ